MADVTVVIPTYNRKAYLKEAVESCFAGNDDLDVEVVVVDDGSTDGTRAYLEGLEDNRVQPIFQRSKGAQAARNRGAQAATGRYVKFLDDDDWLIEGALSEEVDQLDEAGCEYSYGNFRVRSPNDEWLFRQDTSTDVAAAIFRERMWSPPFGFLYTSKLLEEIQWDESIPYHQDYAFVVEVACSGFASIHINRPVGIIRNHEGDRMDDMKSSVPIEDYYGLKVNIIRKGVRLLEKNNLLRPHHIDEATQGIWNWAHIVAGYDIETFERFYEEIRDLKPDFRPERRQKILRCLDAVFGVRGTERLLYPLRRTKNAIVKPRQ